MTTNELIEKLKGLGFTVKESEGYIHIETGNTDMHYSKNISPNDDWAKVLPLLAEYYQTPLDERKPEKKYRVRLQGFNSDRGPQFLTESNNGNMGKLFACAWRPSLKQTFTKKELEAIQNRTQFKGVIWFRELIKDGLREFNGDDNE